MDKGDIPKSLPCTTGRHARTAKSHAKISHLSLAKGMREILCFARQANVAHTVCFAYCGVASYHQVDEPRELQPAK